MYVFTLTSPFNLFDSIKIGKIISWGNILKLTETQVPCYAVNECTMAVFNFLLFLL